MAKKQKKKRNKKYRPNYTTGGRVDMRTGGRVQLAHGSRPNPRTYGGTNSPDYKDALARWEIAKEAGVTIQFNDFSDETEDKEPRPIRHHRRRN